MTSFYLAGHALIKKSGKYLVTRRSSRNDYMPLKWDIPGGTIESGERVEEGLEREVMEEAGIRIRIERVLYIYTNLSQLPERQTFQSVYLCSYVQGDVRTDPEEHDQFAWLDKEEMKQIDTIAFLREFLNSAAFQTQVS